jgi:hypothetical protein
VQQSDGQRVERVAEEKVRVLTYLTLYHVCIDGARSFFLLSSGVGMYEHSKLNCAFVASCVLQDCFAPTVCS